MQKLIPNKVNEQLDNIVEQLPVMVIEIKEVLTQDKPVSIANIEIGEHKTTVNAKVIDWMEDLSKIKPDVLEILLPALESGKYKQGFGVLKDIVKVAEGAYEHRFCALGVVAQLFGGGNTSNKSLNSPHAHNLGITDNAQRAIYNLNDSGLSFKGIAQVIRHYNTGA